MSGETEQQESAWTTDTALAFMQKQHDDLRRQLEERFAAQEKALATALVAQQNAMRTALEAADKAVQAALESAEKAVAKEEKSANDRFAAVNEFRGTLTDQTATFMPRTEAEARIKAASDKLDEHTIRADLRFAEITTRLDREAGKDTGGEARTARAFALVGAVGTVFSIILAVVALITVFSK